MKFECVLEKLLESVSISEKITGKKESLPILSCVVINVSDSIVFKSTNLETAVEIKVDGSILKKGDIAVPANIFLQTLQSTKGEKVILEENDGNLIIKSKSGETTIKSTPKDEFPSFPKPKSKNSYKIKKDILINGIQSVSYASSNSMIRPELASIYIVYSDSKLVFVATDSFRLAEKKFNTPLNYEIPDILIPTKNAIEITNVIGNIDEEDIEVIFDESQINISIGNIRLVSRIIDGNFPNYNEIIPKSFSSEAILLKDDLANVLKKTRIFSGASQQVSFHIYPKNKIFSITARNSDVGEMSDDIEAVVSGDDIDIHFNLQYIQDCVQSLKADSVNMQFAGEGKPLVIKGVPDQQFTYLVMPLNK
ncbi:DNA polymerase III subunit beta [Candidatus Kaiserbacteria bacterium CG10_big_fil_rev_8_21_14_0_10_43_70]|uniref:Beta sliding clamp n=1 Tax=Candidatus Kaiserbacteria bacterium CG10_big_fil_rev_8_21_14_0_10_43_70 TaxID=1974605 RepID=A0A2H0UJL7_9BACT|nr:MAG: DNA polymerase III subunit beta [Candidatus Kaiserbacteria bacterium CG10_big_fil_rev_8_21_14_0_10_43_70]